jgi:hypothetical protein
MDLHPTTPFVKGDSKKNICSAANISVLGNVLKLPLNKGGWEMEVLIKEI